MANSKKGTKQVNPPTPKQRVNSTFGNKGSLVDALLDLIGESDSKLRASLMQVSNTRLMSHHHNAKRLVTKFGDKNGAIEAILGERYPKGAPDGYREKLEAFSAWRLIDEHRQAQDASKRHAKADATAARTKAIKVKRRAKIRAKKAARKA